MDTTPDADTADHWRSLLHRWFVQYNPIYLLSAALVLGGVILVSRGLAEAGSMYGALGVAAIAEVYACALIGSAALLTRIGQRRPAVLLALVTALYQSDLTLHTETCAYLGMIGVFASLSWLGLFVAKLYALAWAVRVRITRRAGATVVLAATALACGPFVVPMVGPRHMGIALALVVFGLATLLPRTTDETATLARADGDWPATVLRRCVFAISSLWIAALGVHVLFWSSQRPIALGYVALSLVFFTISTMRRERYVWAVTAVLCIATWALVPAAFSACVLLASLALLRRAFVRLPVDVPQARDAEGAPYRAAGQATVGSVGFRRADDAARVRLASGALLGMYLALWTIGFHGGGAPPHGLVLDVAVGAVAVGVAWVLRSRVPLGVPAVVWVHGVGRMVPLPRTMTGWGAIAVAAGFGLLFLGVAVSARLGRRGVG